VPLLHEEGIVTTTVNKRLTQTGLWTALAVGVAILGILLLSTIDTPDGEPWLESSTIAQTLSLLAVVGAAVLPSVLGTRKDAAEVREQVQNAHMKPDGTPLNLRDDLDDKHNLTSGALKHLTALVEGVIDDQRNDREDRRSDRADIRALTKRVDTVTSHVGELRKTLGTATSEIHVIADTLSPSTEEHPRA
jgi:hypothetical protein